MTREELKQAGTKKLISALQYCGRDSYYATYYDEVVDEITQRLNRIEALEKENTELKEQLTKAKEILRSLYFIIQSRIDYKNNIGIADEMWRAEQALKKEVSE